MTDLTVTRRGLVLGAAGGLALGASGALSNARAAEKSETTQPFDVSIETHKADSKGLGHVVVGHGNTPVLVMHEWLGDHRNYADAWKYLSGNTYTYIFADLRGYGLSKDLKGEYTAEEAAKDAFALMDRHGHGKFHLAGHSMSGMVAQRMALDSPDKLLSMFLASPVPADGFKADPAAMAALQAVVHDDAALKTAIDGRTGKRLGDGFLSRKAWISRTSSTPGAMLGYLHMFTGTDFIAALKGSKVRVSALCGAYDVPSYRPDAVRAKLESIYTDPKVTEDREAGHYTMLETPAFYASTLEKHLAGGGA